MKKIINRPSWDEYFLELSDLVSTRATCLRLKVGAVLVKDKKIISTGYNGAPKKLPDCLEAGCYIVDNHCIRTIHAEVNAVVQAAFHGISTADTIIYVNWLPCYHCAKVLVNAGINQIVFRRIYRPDPVTKKLLRQAKIKLLHLKNDKKST